jgi:hypothetical protein
VTAPMPDGKSSDLPPSSAPIACSHATPVGWSSRAYEYRPGTPFSYGQLVERSSGASTGAMLSRPGGE